MIIDGPGAATVFNGNMPRYDMRYTMSNNYIAGISINFYIISDHAILCIDSIIPAILALGIWGGKCNSHGMSTSISNTCKQVLLGLHFINFARNLFFISSIKPIS